ncbi:glycine cleavage system aminomethyltransferase GcvT [Methylocaldum sp. RMAD-M]|jgi:aminomethyltransferase|uniref:glycine cleavage system aminomethyltransferase GcvT n=1 Tax=Methylocaldum sp. RMAD-M TaxID=2806557 RepID=UPI000A32935A|nr:glycine cleavage system aminomethyltransferase GcvT [Methylocaldum sp. RMAD-M]MBP1148221.1 aminomethyltransferase [Methylocaldum sp. RMAD-M]
MVRKTILNEIHRQAGGRMVEFAGWELPLHYGSQLEEHHAVRRDAGVFDVSHMTVIDLDGADCGRFLRMLLANDVDRLSGPGKALYSCVLNESGGILDDLTVFRRAGDRFRIVSNAATRDKVISWIQRQVSGFSVGFLPRQDLAIIAAQGPETRRKARDGLPSELHAAVMSLAPFEFAEADDWFLSCSGYTGEDGLEIILPQADAAALWAVLIANGFRPCGLGARDTLRLEAGMRLYGLDMDETVSPLESGLGWTVAWEPVERQFIGRKALEEQRKIGQLRRFVGLVLNDKGVLRHGQKVVVPPFGEGVVTSGIFSPTLNRSVGFARLPPGSYERAWVEIRGQSKEAWITPPRFVRQGHAAFGLDRI